MTSTPKKVEDTIASRIARLEQALATAMSDCNSDACADFLSDDFSEITGIEGKSLSVSLRADWLRSLGSPAAKRFRVDDTAVSVHGAVVIATMLWTQEEKQGTTQWIITDIWKTVSGEWRLAERHVGQTCPRTS